MTSLNFLPWVRYHLWWKSKMYKGKHRLYFSATLLFQKVFLAPQDLRTINRFLDEKITSFIWNLFACSIMQWVRFILYICTGYLKLVCLIFHILSSEILTTAEMEEWYQGYSWVVCLRPMLFPVLLYWVGILQFIYYWI